MATHSIRRRLVAGLVVLIPLGITTKRAFDGRYTAESHRGVWLCSTYWHFLDAVWLMMFGTFLVLG